ncbi:MAG: cyanophycin synthetase [Frankiales bacterium]|nr:cyanophycin synthetase [Frankiales bacterium]
MPGHPATVVELRVLEGPNAFFPKPAVKLVLDVGPLTSADGSLLAALGGKPGGPGSLQRRRWTARLVGGLVRDVAAAAGTGRLAVRSRPGHDVDRLVVAFPWRVRGRAEALALAVADLVAQLPSGVDRRAAMVADAASRVAAAAAGEPASVRRPGVPTVAVTGTNGKTTTTRLIAHIGRAAGLSVAWTSTDGVYVDGVALEHGDWSGPGGAALALDQPGLGLAVLETARGGILLRGMAVSAVDVGVVTNVAADHLGLQDIHTVDELAEVKAVVARVVRAGGWVVLNGDDPRVLAMRTQSKGTPIVFSLDPHSPSIRTALDAGGSAVTVADGSMCLVDRRGDLDPVLPVLEVPVTLSGLSSHNTANALAALGAAVGLGLPRAAIVEGLRTFVPDLDLNPGRMNLWDCAGVAVVVDLAHNEDGLRALLQVARGLRLPGGSVRLVAGTAGDRTDEVLRGIGHIAVHGADDVAVADKLRYLRDRDASELHEQISEGAGQPLERYPDELTALGVLVSRSSPGDVVAVMCHEQLDEVGAYLRSRGATVLDAEQVATRVRAAQAGSR